MGGKVAPEASEGEVPEAQSFITNNHPPPAQRPQMTPPKQQTPMDPKLILFQRFDLDQDGFLSPTELDALITFATTPLSVDFPSLGRPAEITKVFADLLGPTCTDEYCLENLLPKLSKFQPSDPRGLSFLEFKVFLQNRFIRVTLLGDPSSSSSSSGKTTLINRWGLDPATQTRTLDFGNQLSVTLKITEADSINSSLKGEAWDASLFLVVFDSSSETAWGTVASWLRMIHWQGKYRGASNIIVIANRKDLEAHVPYERPKDFVQGPNIRFNPSGPYKIYEISGLKDQNYLLHQLLFSIGARTITKTPGLIQGFQALDGLWDPEKLAEDGLSKYYQPLLFAWWILKIEVDNSFFLIPKDIRNYILQFLF